jgi:hypothetical protein
MDRFDKVFYTLTVIGITLAIIAFAFIALNALILQTWN